MPLSKKEHRTLYDTIYVDMLDLTEKIKSQLKESVPNHEIINTLRNATVNIPQKAVRLIGKTTNTK